MAHGMMPPVRGRFALLVSAILALACLAPYGAAFSQQTQQQELPKVTVAKPETKDVADSIEFTGTVTSIQSVDLVARVEGYLEEILFEDGTFVEEGDVLFTIEPDQYEQNLAESLASLRYAQEEYARQQALLADNATSVSSVQQAQSDRDQAAAQARLDEIDLSYTIVSAPFTGRIGSHLVDVGNLVGAGGQPTTIATLDRMVPIYVEFNLNERDALHIRQMRREAGMEAAIDDFSAISVYVGLSNETGFPHEGRLDFIDNTVNTSTGTIAMRAIFDNEDHALFPGLLARVRIPLGQPKPMLVLPNQAIGADQIGNYVLIVDSDNVVKRQSVVLGPLDGNWRSITSGLTAQDRVVVDGLVYAKPGAKVDPVPQSTQSSSETQ